MKKGWLLGVVFLTSALSGASAVGEAPSSIEISIPDYRVTTVGNLDYVKIPGGDILAAEEGRPMVPYYVKYIDYAKGYRVQNVILKERSGLTTATGLRLPVVILSPPPIKFPIEMKKGWYPEKDYDWRVWENPDGSTTLIIIIYPFYYDPETTNVKFYKNYQFGIEFIVSSVAITSLTAARDIYNPGDKVAINIWLNNSDKAQDVIVSVVIKQYGSDKLVDALPLRSLKNLSGDASLTVEWDSKNTDLGYYYAEATLTDVTGNVLDRDRVGFAIQLTKAPEEPTPTPEPAKPGKFPTLYLIIGIVAIAAIVAVSLVMRLRKKA